MLRISLFSTTFQKTLIFCFIFCEQINATAQALDDISSNSSAITSQIAETSSLIIEQQDQNVHKKIKDNKNWTIYIVTSIVQTLEDVCVNIANPQIKEVTQSL